MIKTRRYVLSIFRSQLDEDGDLLELSKVRQKIHKETKTHEPFTEGACQVNLVSL